MVDKKQQKNKMILTTLDEFVKLIHKEILIESAKDWAYFTNKMLHL